MKRRRRSAGEAHLFGHTNGGSDEQSTRPEIVLYEPLPSGRLRITGAGFLVLADAWDEQHPGDPPQLMGQLFHRFESPNRFGLPAFYTLHSGRGKKAPPERS